MINLTTVYMFELVFSRFIIKHPSFPLYIQHKKTRIEMCLDEHLQRMTVINVLPLTELPEVRVEGHESVRRAQIE